MAQTIKLKRSSTEGKVPTTSQLALGEIAINTYDGRIFFEKNDGSAGVEQILTTDSITTGSVSITGSLQADNLLFDGATISSDLELVIDSSADIILDAGADDIRLKVGGTEYGRFNNDSSNLNIFSSIQDKDIVFRGDDGGSSISALTLDMSAAGAATFHGGIADAGTIAAGTWNGSAISTTYLSGQSGTNTGDETQATINALDITELGTISSGVWQGSAISTTYLSNTSGTNTGDETKTRINALDITEVGTIDSGVWNGTAIASAYLDSDTAHLSGTQTFSGAKTFGADVSVAASQDLLLTNSSKIIMDSDFKIYKNIGNNSIIEEGGSGNLLLISNNEVKITSGELGETFAKFEKDGSIELYEDNTKRFETTTTGVNIIGKTETDTATVTDSTQSTSKTTGALRVTGGVGIAKTLNVGEDVVAFASSDERYKDLITPIENPNEKIKLLSGNTFVWNDKHEVFKGKKDIGVIAQEVEKVLPEIVETRDNGYKAVKYEKIVALLIESNKELIKRVEDLEANLSAEKGRD